MPRGHACIINMSANINKIQWVYRSQPLKFPARRVVISSSSDGYPQWWPWEHDHGGPASHPTTRHTGRAKGKNAGFLAPCCNLLVSRPRSSIQSPQNRQTISTIRRGDRNLCFWRYLWAYVKYAIQRLKNDNFTPYEPREVSNLYQEGIYGTRVDGQR